MKYHIVFGHISLPDHLFIDAKNVAFHKGTFLWRHPLLKYFILIWQVNQMEFLDYWLYIIFAPITQDSLVVRGHKYIF